MSIEKNALFWLVWSPTGHRPPSFKHPTKGEAETEAQRLAREHRGQIFVVLEPKSAWKVDDMVNIVYGDVAANDIPF